MPTHALIGSERQPMHGARSVGKAEPAERLEVSVILRHRASDSLKDRVAKLATGERPDRHLEPRGVCAAIRSRSCRHHRGQAFRQHSWSCCRRGRRGAPHRRSLRHGRPVQQRIRGRSRNLRAPRRHLSRADRSGPSARRIARCRNGGARPRQPPAGAAAVSHAPVSRQCALAPRIGCVGLVHADRARLALRLSEWHRAGRVHRHHRARRRLPHRRPAKVLRRTQDRVTKSVGSLGRSWAQQSHRRSQRSRRRGHAGYRGGRSSCAGSEDRRLFRAQYRCGFPRRGQHGSARCHEQAVGDFDQLGRSRIVVDRAIDDGVRRGAAGRRRNGGHRVRGIGRRWIG